MRCFTSRLALVAVLAAASPAVAKDELPLPPVVVAPGPAVSNGSVAPVAPAGQARDSLGRVLPKGYVFQSLQGVLPDMAERLHRALTKGGKSSLRQDGVSVAFEWAVQSSHLNEKTRSFDLTAHMIGDYRIFDRPAGPLGWVKNLFNSDKPMTFRYDKTVLIEYDAATKVLSVTMPEATEQVGTYNVVVKGKARSELSAKPQVNIASKSFGISLGASKDEYTAAVTGLPYVLAPQLVLETLGQARYLQLKIGFNWESRGQLVATASGLEDKRKVDLSLSYAGTDVAAEVARTSETTPFEGTISVKGDGQGLLARLVYMEEVGGWKADLTADQSWQIASSTMPILKVGDVHTTKTEAFNKSSPSAPRDASARPAADLLRLDVPATEAIDRIRALQNCYGAPGPAGAAGLVEGLKR